MKDQSETICALSTPPGRSGLAVVRVSGERSFELFRLFFRSKRESDVLQPRVVMLGKLVDPRDGSEIDEALATCFRGPHSYTGEDMVELSLHGSPVLIASLLDALCASGARPAEPGEFSMRAFLHGRMDLTQAEAVRDIIDAATRRQALAAARQRSGSIARQIRPLKDRLVEIIADLESSVEFVEEDLLPRERDDIANELGGLRTEMDRWIGSYRRGKIVHDGISMAVVGLPNAGKSSVFNALLAQQRSIVNDMPGTTRDMIAEHANLDGIPVRLLDTAGICNSDDRVEQLGVERSMQAIADSDVILLVTDSSRPQLSADLDLGRKLLSHVCIAVMNKSDLPACWTAEEKRRFAGEWPQVEVSAKTGCGIEKLRRVVLDTILGSGGTEQDGIMLTNLRHYRCLERAKDFLENAAEALSAGISEEFVLLDLHNGLRTLGEITGETQVEEILDRIFSRFCVGK